MVSFREIPWLQERIEKTFASESEANRKEYFRGYEAVLNDAYLVVDAADRLLALSVWEPDLRIYDEQGRMLRQLDFTWSDRDGWSTQFDQELAKAMAGRQRSVMLVFQDLAIDPDRDLLAIALTSDCPGLLFVDFAGRLVEELCLVDTEGGGIAAGSIHPLGEGRWLATNESGVYWFKMGDPQATSYGTERP